MAVVTRVRAASLVLAASLLMCAAAAAGSRENQVKATFLLKFTNFVDWPTSISIGRAAPFRICVIGDAAFATAVDSAIAGEKVRGHPLRRVSLAPQEDPRACQVLYIGRSEQPRAGALLSAVRDAPVLTVGEGARFLRQGGAIAFVLENNRVRFDVNVRAVETAGLFVSSKLLRVARKVERGVR